MLLSQVKPFQFFRGRSKRPWCGSESRDLIRVRFITPHLLTYTPANLTSCKSPQRLQMWSNPLLLKVSLLKHLSLVPWLVCFPSPKNCAPRTLLLLLALVQVLTLNWTLLRNASSSAEVTVLSHACQVPGFHTFLSFQQLHFIAFNCLLVFLCWTTCNIPLIGEVFLSKTIPGIYLVFKLTNYTECFWHQPPLDASQGRHTSTNSPCIISIWFRRNYSCMMLCVLSRLEVWLENTCVQPEDVLG